MDALGTNCFSESCPALQLQSAEDAIACTNPQQYVEDVGNDGCKWRARSVPSLLPVRSRVRLTNMLAAIGLKELPGGNPVY